MTLKVEWVDRNREPQCAANPDYPRGMDADLSEGAAKTCTTKLPYPARRCGIYIVSCDQCGNRHGITTAGRPDDPRSITMACYEHAMSPGVTRITIGPFGPKESP